MNHVEPSVAEQPLKREGQRARDRVQGGRAVAKQRQSGADPHDVIRTGKRWSRIVDDSRPPHQTSGDDRDLVPALGQAKCLGLTTSLIPPSCGKQ